MSIIALRKPTAGETPTPSNDQLRRDGRAELGRLFEKNLLDKSLSRQQIVDKTICEACDTLDVKYQESSKTGPFPVRATLEDGEATVEYEKGGAWHRLYLIARSDDGKKGSDRPTLNGEERLMYVTIPRVRESQTGNYLGTAVADMGQFSGNPAAAKNYLLALIAMGRCGS
jgi:hypothetical protein